MQIHYYVEILFLQKKDYKKMTIMKTDIYFLALAI